MNLSVYLVIILVGVGITWVESQPQDIGRVILLLPIKKILGLNWTFSGEGLKAYSSLKKVHLWEIPLKKGLPLEPDLHQYGTGGNY